MQHTRYHIRVKSLIAGLLLAAIPAAVAAQDTLPRFSAVLKSNNRVVISWTNAYAYTSQISIQRSPDSLKNFKTILTVPDASVPQNGFVDSKAATPFMFYRLFIVLDSGKYQFSRSKRAIADTGASVQPLAPEGDHQRIVVSDSVSTGAATRLKEDPKPGIKVPPKVEKLLIVKKRDTLIARITEKEFPKFRDSIIYNTKDTLVFSAFDTVIIKPFVPREIYKASKFVYTEKYGNVMISLPEAQSRNYSIRFFEQKNEREQYKFLFDIPKVQSPSLILDKSNFQHAGWFWFELYEEGKLKEKHKFFIPKDF